MKKITLIIIIMTMLVISVGCQQKTPDVAVNDIITNIETNVSDLQGMDKIDLVTETGTTEMLGLNIDDIDEGIIMKPGMSIGAMEVIVIKAKDESKVENIKASLQNHIEKLKESYGGYGAEEMGKIENSILKTNYNYVMFVVMSEPYPAQVEKAFDNSLVVE